jgi:hypothetical protein
MYTTHKPTEEGFEPAGWNRHLSKHVITKNVPSNEQFQRACWIVQKIRQAIVLGSRKPIHQIQAERVRMESEGWDLHFSDNEANKAKLRFKKFTVSWCLLHLRNEISYFIAAGRPLQHTKHLTPDAKPPASAG